MNIIYYIKKLFNKNDINQITYYGNIITIPGRNKYNNNEHMLNNIDYYKNQFTTLLSNNKINFSGDLNIDKLEEDIIMHTDLLLHLIMKDENDKELFFDTETKTDKECNNIIKIEKLKIYFAKCFELFNLLIAEINALEEIKDEHIFIYIRSKKAIDEKVNQLKVSYACHFFQINAINIEMNACINKMKINGINDNDFYNKMVERNNYLRLLLENINININININSDGISKENIALMEYELEKWAYQNSDELNNIYKVINNIHDRFKPRDFDALLNDIEQIQNKLLIFDEFSRNKIEDDKLYKLFKLKFDIYTYYINADNTGSIFKKENTKEYEYYKKIIMDLITGLDSNLLVDFCFDYDKNKAIRYIRNYLKNSNGIFDPEEILENDLKLKLLCAFNPINPRTQIYSFYQNSYFSSDSIMKKINVDLDNVLLINDKFKLIFGTPLSSLFDFFDSSYWDMFQNSKYLYSLYKLKEKRLNHSGIYFLPKNYVNIRLHFINSSTDDKFNSIINEKFARNYQFDQFDINWNKIEDYKSKTLIFPNDVTRWTYPINFDIDFYEIKLNEGIKSLKPRVIPKSVKKLNIPSTLETIIAPSLEKSLWNDIKEITFDNFEDSKILFDNSKLKEILILIIRDKIEDLEILDERVEFVYQNDIYERLFDLDLSKIVIGYLKLKKPKLTFNPSWTTPFGYKILDPVLYSDIRDEYISKVADSIQEQVRYYKKYNISKNRSR